MEWQPIETAPKDGTFVLVWNSKGINEVYWDVDEEFWYHDVDFDCPFPLRGDFPSHWMPLPEPPNANLTSGASAELPTEK